VGHFLTYKYAVGQKLRLGLPIVIISSLIVSRGALKILTHPDETNALTPACFVASKTISEKVELFHVYRGRKEERITRECSGIIHDNRTKSEDSLMVKNIIEEDNQYECTQYTPEVRQPPKKRPTQAEVDM